MKSIVMLKSQNVYQVQTNQNVASPKATKCLDEFIDCVRSPDGLSGNVARPNTAGGFGSGREGRGDELDNNTVDSTSGHSSNAPGKPRAKAISVSSTTARTDIAKSVSVSYYCQNRHCQVSICIIYYYGIAVLLHGPCTGVPRHWTRPPDLSWLLNLIQHLKFHFHCANSTRSRKKYCICLKKCRKARKQTPLVQNTCLQQLYNEEK